MFQNTKTTTQVTTSFPEHQNSHASHKVNIFQNQNNHASNNNFFEYQNNHASTDDNFPNIKILNNNISPGTSKQSRPQQLQFLQTVTKKEQSFFRTLLQDKEKHPNKTLVLIQARNIRPNELPNFPLKFCERALIKQTVSK